MPAPRIPSLNFRYGLEDVTPVAPSSERAVLPTGGNLQPTDGGPASEVEELVRAPSFATAIDDFIRPQIADLAICRPERFATLLDETRDILERRAHQEGGGANDDLMDVLERQDGLRDLLGYYVQSLLSA
jgi:hypothetical protein